MARRPIPTWFFVLAVVRKGHRFLLVHERKHGQRWYLPAGRVEPGESLVEAVQRETLEESGVRITVDGIVRVEHSASADGTRVRVIYTAHPIDDAEPGKTEDSLGAAWVTLEEMEQLPMRGPEVQDLFEYVAGGGLVVPPSIVVPEGAPYR